jgi:hypothetical protein
LWLRIGSALCRQHRSYTIAPARELLAAPLERQPAIRYRSRPARLRNVYRATGASAPHTFRGDVIDQRD